MARREEWAMIRAQRKEYLVSLYGRDWDGDTAGGVRDEDLTEVYVPLSR